jgi:regulator of sigma E protease
MTWAIALLALIALIVLHEFGHFLAAKAVGMRVERFSLFFPPTIFRVRRGETEYAIGAIPAGGYVKITGMSPEEVGSLEPEVARRAYYNQAPWKRIVVILAGPFVNIAIAFLLFWIVLFTGSLNGDVTLAELNPSLTTLVSTTSVGAVEKGKPAYGRLLAGDRVVAVDGHKATLASAIGGIGLHRCAGKPTEGCRATTPVQLTVLRKGQRVNLSLYPVYDKQVGRMLVGVSFAAAAKSFGVFGASGAALHEMWGMAGSLLSNLRRAFTNAKVRSQVHTVVGIVEIEQETIVAGPGYAIAFIGFISLILAVMNLLPFLPLDGGHIVWSLAEKLRGRRISVATMYRFSSVGIVALLFLVISAAGNEFSRL